MSKEIWAHNLKKVPMGVEISAGDLIISKKTQTQFHVPMMTNAIYHNFAAQMSAGFKTCSFWALNRAANTITMVNAKLSKSHCVIYLNALFPES